MPFHLSHFHLSHLNTLPFLPYYFSKVDTQSDLRSPLLPLFYLSGLHFLPGLLFYTPCQSPCCQPCLLLIHPLHYALILSPTSSCLFRVPDVCWSTPLNLISYADLTPASSITKLKICLCPECPLLSLSFSTNE